MRKTTCYYQYPQDSPGSLAPGPPGITAVLRGLSHRQLFLCHPDLRLGLFLRFPSPLRVPCVRICSLFRIPPLLRQGHRVLTDAVWEKLVTDR